MELERPEAIQGLARERKAFWRWDPGRSLLASIRRWQALNARSGIFPPIWRRVMVIRYRFWSVVTGADIPLTTTLGEGLLLPHPNGVVMHPDVCLGADCLVMQQVTLGTDGHSGAPTLGLHVDVGAGAKVIGGVTIGDFAVIGANAVVLNDVPAWHVAVGVPARCHMRKDAPTEIRSGRSLT
jgi:serine O-acetyltransferase